MKCNACDHEYTNKEKGIVEFSSREYCDAVGTVGDKRLGAIRLVFCPKCGTVAVRDNYHRFELER